MFYIKIYKISKNVQKITGVKDKWVICMKLFQKAEKNLKKFFFKNLTSLGVFVSSGGQVLRK